VNKGLVIEIGVEHCDGIVFEPHSFSFRGDDEHLHTAIVPEVRLDLSRAVIAAGVDELPLQSGDRGVSHEVAAVNTVSEALALANVDRGWEDGRRVEDAVDAGASWEG